MSSSLLLHRRGRWGGALVAALLLAAPIAGAPAAGADNRVSFVTSPSVVVKELANEETTSPVTVLNSTRSIACITLTVSAPPMTKNDTAVDPPTVTSGTSCPETDDPKNPAPGELATWAVARADPGSTVTFTVTVLDDYTAPFSLVASTTAGAEARMEVPDRAEDPPTTPPTTPTWGQAWWDKDLLPALQLGMEVLLLLLVVSLVANWMADEARPVWRRTWRPAYFRLTGYAVVIAGGLRLLLMHTPAERSDLADSIASWLGATWWLAAVTLSLCTVVLLVWVFEVFLAKTTNPSRFLLDRDHSVRWVGAGVVSALVAFGFAGWRLDKGADQPWWSSIGTGLALVVVGTGLIAWQSAYHVRLRLSSGNDKDDAWPIRRERLATELLGREGEGQHRVTISGAADASPLTDDALAAATGSAVLKAIVAVVTAVVPHAGLELRVTSLGAPDAGDDKAAKADPAVLLAASLTRGRNEIAAVEVDSRELHPASERVDAVRHDSELDAVSAVAAWARWKIGREMKHPAWSLYGADSWLGIALQQAGARRDDAGQHKSARILFARARGEDVGNLQARFNVLSSSVGPIFASDPDVVDGSNDTRTAEAIKLMQDVDQLDRQVRLNYPGTQLALRSQYLRTAIYLYARDKAVARPAGAGLLMELERLGADPFRYLAGLTDATLKAVRDEGRGDATASETVPGMPGGRSRLDRREVTEFAEFLAPTAAVLCAMTLDAEEASSVLHKLAGNDDLPHRARYNLACGFAEVGEFDEAWTHLRDAVAVDHLGYWAVRDPSLTALWGLPDPVGKDGKTYLDLYVERLYELGRKPRLEKGSALVDAGLDGGLVLKLGMLGNIDSVKKLKEVDPVTLTFLTKDQQATVTKKKGTLDLAAVPAIGAANADLLATAGITSIPSLLDTSTGQVVERVAAAGQATEKDTTKLTYTTIRGWQLAARDAEPPHHEYVGIVTGDGTVVLVES